MKLTKPGQIKIGDGIFCAYEGIPRVFKVEDVLRPGTDKEEIILIKEINRYFITSMAIDGTSWAKNVHIERKQSPLNPR